MKIVCIKIDADQLKISHLVQMKKLFSQYSGKTPVRLEFHAEEEPIGKVHIDERWGIDLSEELKGKLMLISSLSLLD